MLKIRKTKKSDIRELSKIYKETYDKVDIEENWTNSEAKALLSFYFNIKTFLGLTVLKDNQIIGAFFSYIKPWYDGNHLAEGELFIHPRYQGQKIGTNLYLEMMKLADKKGCLIHELLTYSRPSKWYQKIGFKQDSLRYMSGNIKGSY